MTKVSYSLAISIASIEESPKYNSDDFDELEIVSAHIVERGTEGGNPTVDLILVDAEGRKHIAMTTGYILESLGKAIAGVRARTTTH